MKKIIKIKIFLIIIILSLKIFSQQKSNEFDNKCEEIILIISKEIYLEKKPEKLPFVSQIKSLSSFKELLKNENLKKNIELLDNILNLKKKDISGNNLKDSLTYFWKKAKEIIPKKEEKNRGKTIEKLDSLINKFINEINRDSNNDNVNLILKSSNENTDEIKSDLVELLKYFLILCTLILTSLTVSFIYLFKKIKDIIIKINNLIEKIKNLEYKLKNSKPSEKEQIRSQSTNYSSSEKKFSGKSEGSIPQKNSNELKTDKSQEEKKYTEIQSKEIVNSEYTVPEKISEELNTEKSQEEKKFPSIKYAETPERAGYFDISMLKDDKTQRSLYKITFWGNDRIEFDIINNNNELCRYAMNNSDVMLKPACEFFGLPMPENKMIKKINNEPGLLKKEDNKLLITKKIQIEFK